jgi:signal transduction histidine kinase/ligand-binding sensor domain-containing protein
MTVGAVARFLFAAVLCAHFSAGGYASARERTLAEMDHKSWTARDGAPQGVTALAQATDDVLWIGTEGGLFTFDGRTFSAFQPQPGEPELPAGTVRTLLATRDRAIWVGFRYGGVAQISQGRVKLFTQADRLQLADVNHIQQSSDGELWALTRQQNLIRFGADGTWHVELTPRGDPGGRIHDLFIDSSDTLWLAQGGRLYRRPLNQSEYFATDAEADWLFGFAETPDHSLWVNDSITNAPGHPTGRTQHLDRSGKLLARLPYTNNIFDMLYTPDGSLIMLPTGEGLLRVSAQALTDRAQLEKEVREDTYEQKRNGLSSNHLRVLLLDADGNLWVGGQRGLDRFRKARLVPFISNVGDSSFDSFVCAGKTGDVWITTAGITRDQLYKISGDSTKSFPEMGQTYSMFCGADGDTWLLSNIGIFNIHADRISSIPSIPGTHPFDTEQIAATPDHTLFASVSGRSDLNGIWRYADKHWTKLTGPGIPSSSPSAEYVDSRGRLLTGYGDGQIGLPLEGGGQLLSSGNPGLGAVFGILETSHGLFAGGLNGLAVLRDDRFEMLDFADRISSLGVGGLVESANGDLWLNVLRGIVHIPAAELQAALQDPRYPMKSELLTEGDFVGPIELRSGKPKTARDADGKLWFATINGLFHIDPGEVDSGGHLPIVSIKSIAADRKPVGTDGAIAPGLQTLDIQYLGVNLTAPDKVTYRYRLDGLENSWQDAGHRTAAIYSRLPPGTYTFRVIASNDSKTWTAPVSSEIITVRPSYYQTTWFLALCGFAGLILIWFLYSLRVRAISHAIRMRAEERADERIRIARDLHDTLLQGIQGLLLTVHVAAQKVSQGEDSTMLLDRALSTADRIISEGRNRVNSLRSEHLTDAELIGSIENMGNDLKRDDKIEFRVKREGIDATLHAHVADEVFFIAREALTNAFRHAEASEITIEVNYDRRYFSLSCTDNGRGFDSEDHEKPGHWGLKGLFERAEQLGGQLNLRSESMLGTQILLAIPSYRAYEGSSRLEFFLRAYHRSERIPTPSGDLAQRANRQRLGRTDVSS